VQALPGRQRRADVVGVYDNLTAHASPPSFGPVAVSKSQEVNEKRQRLHIPQMRPS